MSAPSVRPDLSITLVVDLDGTLTPVDTLHESLARLLRRQPLQVLQAPLWLAAGRAGFKNAVAQRLRLDPGALPWNQPLLDYLREQKAAGRRLVLATAAHRQIADDVAAHLGLFDAVLATDDGHNLKGEAKLAAIRAQEGERFAYAGDSTADLPVWAGAQAAIVVGGTPQRLAQVQAGTPLERHFERPAGGWAAWLKALRVHQWAKNALLFVPLITAWPASMLVALGQLLLAFLAFSLVASATYVVNDLGDLDNDRAHPRKRLRPLASGALPVLQVLAVALALLLLGFAMALALSPAFALALAVYLVLTTAYSAALKRYVLLDVLALGLLYTIRIIAGAVAIQVAVSSWLLVFSAFIFFSLALVKRCAELVLYRQQGRTASSGRDYRVDDLVVLWPMGVGASLSAVVVFGLFVSAPETLARYATPGLLWITAAGLLYWLGRLWIKTSRGEMHDDPVVYALRDRGSRLTVLAMVAAALAARFVRMEHWL